MPHAARFVSDTDEEWRTMIARSRIFFVLLSPVYLRTLRLWDHIAYARSLSKPFRVAVLDGAVVPEGLFAGVEDLDIRVCHTPEEVADYAMEVASA